MSAIPELDAILAPYQSSAFKDKEAAYRGYRNHCQRMANAALINLAAMGGTSPTPRARKLVAVAAAFHDLGIWSQGTWNYLEPSEKDAKEWMAQQAPGEYPEGDQLLVVRMIEEHHKIFPIAWQGEGLGAGEGETLRMVEAFRRGDWIDVSMGLLRGAVTWQQYKELVSVFPVAGFFGMLLSICISSWLKHPFSNPLPMMRW